MGYADLTWFPRGIAETFWRDSGNVDALRATVAVYGQSWTRIKDKCPELQHMQASQLRDKVSGRVLAWRRRTFLKFRLGVREAK